MKRFADLSEQEVLALAISSEEEDSRIYGDFAEGLRANYPDTAKMFDEMAAEEVRHRGLLFDLYRKKFGEYLPLVRRQDVRGFVRHKPVWLVRPLGLDEVRKYAATMEYETAHFYRKAAEQARDASVRELLVKLAEAEDKHETLAENLDSRILTTDARAREAIELFEYQLLKHTGAMMAVLGGLDTLVFSGGIGEHGPEIRASVCDGLEFLGIRLDRKSNAANAAVISARGSRVAVRVMRTDEEWMIARTVCRVLGLKLGKENYEES